MLGKFITYWKLGTENIGYRTNSPWSTKEFVFMVLWKEAMKKKIEFVLTEDGKGNLKKIFRRIVGDFVCLLQSTLVNEVNDLYLFEITCFYCLVCKH